MILLILDMYKLELETILKSDKKPPVKGALITALNKATKREYVCDLIRYDMGKLDVTPTAAMQLIKRVLGHGVSNKFLLEKFGDSERTAANKSEIFDKDLSDYEKKIKAEMKKLSEQMKLIYKQVRFEVQNI